MDHQKKIETKNPLWAGSLQVFGYSLRAVRGRTLQTPRARLTYAKKKATSFYH